MPNLWNKQLSHWHWHVYDTLRLLILRLTGVCSGEMPVSDDSSLTGMDCDPTYESR
jgi:hypothetical protein